MPSGVPEDVVHVDLSNNSINHLKAKDFLGTKSLRTLNISRNNLQHADTGTRAVACSGVNVRPFEPQIPLLFNPGSFFSFI